MKTAIQDAFDFRQSPFWGHYMRSIGWTVVTLDTIQIYIRKIPLLNTSIIKIQHPIGPIPFKQIDLLAKKHHAMSVTIEPHLKDYNEKHFIQNGYQISSMHHAPTATRKIAIQKPLTEIITNFSDNAKRNIKKAEKNNLTIKTVFGKDDTKNTYFNLFFHLQKHLTDMKKFYAPGYSESKKKHDALKKGSFFVFAYEKNNPNPIAAVWYGYYNGVVTYLQTGITQKGYDTLANYLLVLEGIRRGKQLKCHTFDFESIYDTRYPKEARRWKGYSEFKARFHGEEVYYPPSWLKIYNPLFKLFYTLTKNFLS